MRTRSLVERVSNFKNSNDYEYWWLNMDWFLQIEDEPSFIKAIIAEFNRGGFNE